MAEEPVASAPGELARLDERRALVVGRINELQTAQREATKALQEARTALVEFERRGGSKAEGTKLETQLRTAEARAAEPWTERIEGARAAARDADIDRHQFIAEHLTELVDDRQAAGAEAATRINEHLAAFTAAYYEWNAVAQEIIGLASSIAQLRPGDVSRTRCEAVVREAERLLRSGGELGPVLEHDPRQPRHAVQVSA
jgi:hypothetical protein